MADVKIALKIVSDLKNFISICLTDPLLLNLFRNSKTHFTRDRKLNFEEIGLADRQDVQADPLCRTGRFLW
ncbi:Uncharacterised protein [Sphingobacterium daejeonense]|nr:Uncharacterised protein [Sphingobacterium daejeonense]